MDNRPLVIDGNEAKVSSPRIVSKAVELTAREYKRAVRLAPGTIVQASDRQYRVNERGEWRRVPKHDEVKSEAERAEVPFHVKGRRPEDGQKCWCFPCICFWRGEADAPVD
jgi:hypothetical protein